MTIRTSIIIPTLGEVASCAMCIEAAVTAVVACGEAEVIAVDNSKAGSAELRAIARRWPLTARYVHEPIPGATAARHRGAEEARGELLVFIDDDVEVTTRWLEAVTHAMADSSVGISGGPSVPVFTEPSVPGWWWQFVEPTPYGGWCCGWLSLLDIGDDVPDIDPQWIWSLNLAIRRPLLRDLGGFHPDLLPAESALWQGDGETGLAAKAKAAGVKCMYVHGARIRHHIPRARLTPAYFAARARFQGIADSFTAIRAGHKPPGEPPARPAITDLDDHSTAAQAARELEAQIMAAYRDAWSAHQQAAAADRELLAWVRRADYLHASPKPRRAR